MDENDKDLMWIARAGLKACELVSHEESTRTQGIAWAVVFAEVPLPPPWKPCTTGGDVMPQEGWLQHSEYCETMRRVGMCWG